jgi:hypothetical protein
MYLHSKSLFSQIYRITSYLTFIQLVTRQLTFSRNSQNDESSRWFVLY